MWAAGLDQQVWTRKEKKKKPGCQMGSGEAGEGGQGRGRGQEEDRRRESAEAPRGRSGSLLRGQASVGRPETCRRHDLCPREARARSGT